MKKILILAGLVALTCSTNVFAEDNVAVCPAKNQPPQEIQHCSKMHKPKCDFKKFEEELGLTAKQKEQAKQLREKQMEAAKPIFEQLQQKEQEVQELRAQLRELHKQGKTDFEAILTDKQLKKLEQMKAARKQKFEQHRRHHRPDRPLPCPKPMPVEK